MRCMLENASWIVIELRKQEKYGGNCENIAYGAFTLSLGQKGHGFSFEMFPFPS